MHSDNDIAPLKKSYSLARPIRLQGTDCQENVDNSQQTVRGHPFMTSTRRGEGVRLRWTHVDGGESPGPCGRPHRKFKLESTNVILSSSHAKKLASFIPEFRLWTEKVEIFL